LGSKDRVRLHRVVSDDGLECDGRHGDLLITLPLLSLCWTWRSDSRVDFSRTAASLLGSAGVTGKLTAMSAMLGMMWKSGNRVVGTDKDGNVRKRKGTHLQAGLR
jgi:hypothetical protein